MSNIVPVVLAFSVFQPEEFSPEKAPVIFLHGLFAQKGYWSEIPEKIASATKRKVYTLDARNHGDSPWDESFSFDANVIDLLTFMDTHGIEKAVLVGHSMGGITVMKTALKAPDRVEMLFVEDMGVRNVRLNSTQGLFAKMAAYKEASVHMPTDLAEESDAWIFMIKYLIQNNPAVLRLEPREPKGGRLPQNGYMKRSNDGRFTFKANIDVIIEKIPEERSTDFCGLDDPTTGQFEKPAYFIYGTSSYLQVMNQEESIKKLFPNAQLIPFHNAGHMVHIESPQNFTEVLNECINNKNVTYV